MAPPLKVKQDLKRKLAREIELDERWYDTDYLAAQLTLMLSALPADMATALRQELSPGFVPNLLHTLGFVRQYQQLQRGRLAGEARQHGDARRDPPPLLGWPSTTTSDDGLSPSRCSNARLAGRCHFAARRWRRRPYLAMVHMALCIPVSRKSITTG